MKKKAKIDPAKESRRSSRAVLGETLRGRKPGAHKEHRRRIEAEEADLEMEEGTDVEFDCD